MIILIPSYEPDRKLLNLLEMLHGAQVVVVDDGSGPRYAHWFTAAEKLGATVLHHDFNWGKGQALRTGFEHIARHFPDEPVVCADSDGQHTPEDIARVCDALEAGDADMVLGVREFSGKVPLRSRFGNSVTKLLFRATTGMAISDTQTGLRAYPARMLTWLCDVSGDRFEYELRALLLASRQGLKVQQVPVETIYLDDNSSSHFRPVRDSWLIYRPLLSFMGSSLLGFLIDFSLLSILLWLTGSLVFSVVGARVVSATVNYTVNRQYVFAGSKPLPVRETLPGYAGLAIVILAGNLALMWLLTPLIGASFAKILTEVTLLAISYVVQATKVFAQKRHGKRKLANQESKRPHELQRFGAR